MDGPYLRGHAVYAMALDTRAGRNKLFATAMNSHFGTVLATSDDLGQNWNVPEEPNVTFPEGTELALKQIWQITPGPDDQPDVMYCGVEPAALFKSTDAGASWAPVQGLLDHPHRKQWMPGGGGLCLHTIVQDPTNSDRTRTCCAIRWRWTKRIPRVSTSEREAARCSHPINVFVGERNCRFEHGLNTAVSDGAEVLILAAVSGG